jgi:hypothetical protein
MANATKKSAQTSLASESSFFISGAVNNSLIGESSLTIVSNPG